MYIEHIETLILSKKDISHLDIHTLSPFTHKRLLNAAIESASGPCSIHALLTSCDNETILYALCECNRGGPSFELDCLFIGLCILSRRLGLEALEAYRILTELKVSVGPNIEYLLKERLKKVLNNCGSLSNII
jgi:hypothetical protein